MANEQLNPTNQPNSVGRFRKATSKVLEVFATNHYMAGVKEDLENPNAPTLADRRERDVIRIQVGPPPIDREITRGAARAITNLNRHRTSKNRS
jgi:hypothetical protein